MVRRIALALALLPALALTAGAAPARPAAPATTLTMTLDLADGAMPMADVPVTVYYLPFNPPNRYNLQVMAHATTNTAGQFTATLNTAMVQKTELADVGTGPDAFNAEVIAEAPSRQIVISPQVLQLGRAVTPPRVSAVTNPQTGKPELAAKIPAGPGVPRTDSATQVRSGVASHYRYVPVLAMNSADGMRVNFHYTFDTSTAKQTMAGTAVSVNSGGAGFGPFSASTSTTESTDRSFDRHVYEKNNYHQIIWANYKWIETIQFSGCGKGGCVDEWKTWSIDHWQGSIGQFNPNKECTRFKRPHHRGRCLREKVIGTVKYTPPSFTYCGGNCVTTLNANTPDVTRQSVNSEMYDFQLDVAGFVGLDSQGAYGTITTVTWTRKSGCSGPNQRVLWGYKSDPASTPVLQASCRRLP